METEVRPLKISVPKDSQGRLIRFVEGFLDCESEQTRRVVGLVGTPSTFEVSIPKKQSADLANLMVGEKILRTNDYIISGYIVKLARYRLLFFITPDFNIF